MAHPTQPRPTATNISAAVDGEGEGMEGSPLLSETVHTEGICTCPHLGWEHEKMPPRGCQTQLQ